MIEHAIRHAKAKGAQFILLGTGGSDGPLRAMAGQLKDDPDLRFVFAFSDELSHYLFGAADMILVPSIFEPCGLTQMLGQRYGAVPIVRRTGGLADTVDSDPENGTGFAFDGQGQPDVTRAVDEALAVYGDAARWDALVKRCMSKDNRRARARLGTAWISQRRAPAVWCCPAAVRVLPVPDTASCPFCDRRLSRSFRSWDTSFAAYSNIYNQVARG